MLDIPEDMVKKSYRRKASKMTYSYIAFLPKEWCEHVGIAKGNKRIITIEWLEGDQLLITA